MNETTFTLSTSISNIVIPEPLFLNLLTWLNSFDGIDVEAVSKDFETVIDNTVEFIRFKTSSACSDIVYN